jgi:hypothetical protein
VPSTTTQTSIANRGLQLLGSEPISSLSENSRGARAMNRAYQPVLYSELRKNFWNFAIVRTTIAAAAVGPSFGKSSYFPLPGDFLDLANPDMVFGVAGGGTLAGNQILAGTPVITGTPILDWQIESMPGGGLAIASNQIGPINVRYVSSNVREAQFDPCFDEAFSAALALMTCEELTQSNTKLQNIANVYDQAIEIAKKRNAFEGRPIQPPADTFVISRF